MVHHNWYIDENADRPVPICARTAAELGIERVTDPRVEMSRQHPIPKLADVLEEFAGKISLEIELKGPEPEAAASVASTLRGFRRAWSLMEITSFHPALLTAIRDLCPGLAIAYLFPLSEPWMRLDVVAHAALQTARLAKADAVHLHPNQLSEDVTTTVREGGVEIHAHAVNDEAALKLAQRLGLPWICSDAPEQALAFRRAHT